MPVTVSENHDLIVTSPLAKIPLVESVRHGETEGGDGGGEGETSQARRAGINRRDRVLRTLCLYFSMIQSTDAWDVIYRLGGQRRARTPGDCTNVRLTPHVVILLCSPLALGCVDPSMHAK
jgi:hypothetical protein